jgi:hypothetical protein
MPLVDSSAMQTTSLYYLFPSDSMNCQWKPREFHASLEHHPESLENSSTTSTISSKNSNENLKTCSSTMQTFLPSKATRNRNKGLALF